MFVDHATLAEAPFWTAANLVVPLFKEYGDYQAGRISAYQAEKNSVYHLTKTTLGIGIINRILPVAWATATSSFTNPAVASFMERFTSTPVYGRLQEAASAFETMRYGFQSGGAALMGSARSAIAAVPAAVMGFRAGVLSAGQSLSLAGRGLMSDLPAIAEEMMLSAKAMGPIGTTAVLLAGAEALPWLAATGVVMVGLAALGYGIDKLAKQPSMDYMDRVMAEGRLTRAVRPDYAALVPGQW